METKNRAAILRLKAIPWARVIVDALLLAGMGAGIVQAADELRLRLGG
jgi:hypothetical protein